jgi:hypothetical protein
MGSTQTAEKPSFESVWTLLQEISERQKETDRIVKENAEQQKETARQMEETDRLVKENARQMKKTDKKIGDLGKRFGEVVEYLLEPGLIEQFASLGFSFERSHRNTLIRDAKNNIFTEIDIFLENGDRVMAVEAKTKPDIRDIDYHVERMKKLRLHADKNNDKRKYLGAIAGVVINENERRYAFKNGFYVIEPSGDAFTIAIPEGEYSVREW